MEELNRRTFLKTAAAATVATAAPALAKQLTAAHRHQRVFVASGSKDGILAYNWDPASGELTPDGVAAQIPSVSWITYSSATSFSLPRRKQTASTASRPARWPAFAC